MERAKRWLSRLDTFFEYITLVFLALMTIIITWQVFSRYVLNETPSWSEETALILMVWVGFLRNRSRISRETAHRHRSRGPPVPRIRSARYRKSNPRSDTTLWTVPGGPGMAVHGPRQPVHDAGYGPALERAVRVHADLWGHGLRLQCIALARGPDRKTRGPRCGRDERQYRS